METVLDLLFNPVTLIILINIFVLILALPRPKSRFRWSHLFQLLIFDTTALYILASGIPLGEMSVLAWVAMLVLLVWPIVL